MLVGLVNPNGFVGQYKYMQSTITLIYNEVWLFY